MNTQACLAGHEIKEQYTLDRLKEISYTKSKLRNNTRHKLNEKLSRHENKQQANNPPP